MLETIPSFPYSFKEMRYLGRWLTRKAAPFTLGPLRVPWLEMRFDWWEPGWSVGTHSHSFYEGHLLLEGRGEYVVEHPQFLDPGQVLLHGPHVPHAWHVPPTSGRLCKVMVIWFTLEPTVPLTWPAEWPCWPDLCYDLALLLRDAETSAAGRGDRVRMRLAMLISRLLSLGGLPAEEGAMPAAPQSPPPYLHTNTQFESEPTAFSAVPPLSSRDTVPIIEQFLADNLSRTLSLADIAAHAGMSERNMIRRFREWTGETVWERLDKLRMRQAAQLLKETTLSIAEIGARIGMPEPSYFTRRFRRCFDTTPDRYRHGR